MNIGRKDIADAGFRRRDAAGRHSTPAKRKMVNIWQGLPFGVEEKLDFNRP
jgi:hypothetical protein